MSIDLQTVSAPLSASHPPNCSCFQAEHIPRNCGLLSRRQAVAGRVRGCSGRLQTCGENRTCLRSGFLRQKKSACESVCNAQMTFSRFEWPSSCSPDSMVPHASHRLSNLSRCLSRCFLRSLYISYPASTLQSSPFSPLCESPSQPVYSLNLFFSIRPSHEPESLDAAAPSASSS